MAPSNGASNFSVTGGNFLEIHGNYNVHNYESLDTGIAPLPPLKHSSALFTGRDKDLHRLKDYFTPTSGSGRKSFLLHGMGGIGKTQICLKFIEQTTDWFSDVFWIDASSEDAIDLRLRQIAKAYNLPANTTASATLQWISSRDSWLMLYDNADGGCEVVEKFLPPGDRGNILFTSRNKSIGRLTSYKNTLEVGQMGEEEAVSLLLHASGHDIESAQGRAIAKQIVSELGCIPLAIDQAGSGCSLSGYLDLYLNHHSQLMSKSGFKDASDYGYSTYGTWEISMIEIESRAANMSGPIAFAALRVLLCFTASLLFCIMTTSQRRYSKMQLNNFWKGILELAPIFHSQYLFWIQNSYS